MLLLSYTSELLINDFYSVQAVLAYFYYTLFVKWLEVQLLFFYSIDKKVHQT